MAAGITKRLWEIGDIVGVLEAWEAGQLKAVKDWDYGQHRHHCLE
jgi:hypothetical protein